MLTCVIGGGIIGCITSYYLQLKGHQVILIEKNRSLCNQTSKSNASLLCFDSTFSLYEKSNLINLKDTFKIVTKHPVWMANYLYRWPKRFEIKDTLESLGSDSQKEFLKITKNLSQFKYGVGVKINDIYYPNTYVGHTRTFGQLIVKHPIHIILNKKVVRQIVSDKNNKIMGSFR